jgi:outer membrane autotransporter protein
MLFIPALLVSGYTEAQVIEEPVTIDASTPLDSYRVTGAGELTANGASTLQISADTGTKLTLNGTNVSASGVAAAVGLVGADAVITGSHISHMGDNSLGLQLGRVSGSTSGSTAHVMGSSITAGGRAVSVSALSTLILQDSTVSGTGATGLGLEMFEGTATATGSTLTGQQNGIRLRGDRNVVATNTLTLDATKVEGVTGSAIIVGIRASEPATATIEVNNGSTLVGGNGKVLEVVGNSTADMTVDNSQLVGDVTAEAGSTVNLTLQNRATLTGRLDNVAHLALNSQGQWNMVGDGQVENLAMDGGAVKFGDAASFYTLSVANLSGNGTFMMDVDFGQARTDFLDITGSATGSHSLLIGSTGTDPLADTNLHVVHAAAGDADFSLAGGAVDLGAWSYDLIKQGDNDWYLDATTRTVSPGTRTVMALFNTAPTVWYGELSTLRSRMGELRFNGGRSGGWMRTYGNKFNVADASGVGYKQVQQGISLGVDGKVPLGDGQWLAGVMAGQSKSDLDLDRGTNGKVDSYYVGVYSTWLDSDTGYYVDGVLKFNRFRNKAKVNLSDGTRSKGDYDNSGVGASLEVGRHIKLDDGYFVEPYTQISGVIIEGKDYELDNGMRAEGDRTRSLLGKVGATAGRNFDLGQGRTVQPYLRAAVAHEFAKNNEVQVNDNVFNNDLSGSRGELGAGVAVALSENLQLHADFDYSNGDNIEQPWGASVGVRYSW